MEKTDLEVLKEMFTRAGLGFDTKVQKDGQIVASGTGKGIVGYSGFDPCFLFDKDGKLIDAGGWE